MPKFNKGETSKSIIDKKNSITMSIKLKTKLIDKINNYEDIPNSLEMKKNVISQTSVHKWSDSELGIISYSYNTAHAEHNLKILESLVKSINNANSRIIKQDNPSNKKTGRTISRLTENEIESLKVENEELRSALAEVYRSYMLLINTYREDKQIDAAYRKLILAQAQILGRERVWEVK